MVDIIIGHWKLNEASGSIANDSTTNGNHAAVTGTSIEEGLFEKCRFFNASTTDRAVVGDLGLFEFGSNPFTVSVWVRKFSTPSYTESILSKWNAASSEGQKEWQLGITTSGVVNFDASSDGYATSQLLTSFVSLVDGSWHLLTVTRSGTSYELYIDGGKADDAFFGPSSINVSGAPMVFGNSTNSSSWDSSFDGYIDNIRIYNYAMSDAEVSELYYNTGYDKFPPIFDPISPVENETGVLVETPIEFRYIDEHTNLDSLFVFVNDYTILAVGAARDGYSVSYEQFSDGYSDGYDGYIVTLYHEDNLPPRSEISVEISAQDAYGNIGSYDYIFFTASDVDPAPTFDNLNPVPGTTGLVPGSSIYFQFNDGYDVGGDLISGADLSTLNMTVDGNSVISGGVIQSGYSGSIVENAYDGYSVTITKDSGWDIASTLDVYVEGQDLNGTSASTSYHLKLGGGPIITNISPSPNSNQVLRDEAVNFTVRDAIYGIDKEDITVTINSVLAYDGDIGLNGHIALVTEIQDGYNVSIGHPTWLEYSEIEIVIDVENRTGGSSNESYSIYTLDETVPVITPISPLPEDTRASLNTDIVFEVTDGYSGVDAYSLDVNVDGYNSAVVDGVAQLGYSVNFVPITDGYSITVSKNSALPESKIISVSITVDDLESNQSTLFYTFSTDDIAGPIITNRVPDDGGTGLPVSPVTFDMHDRRGAGVDSNTLDVTIEAAIAIDDGVFQSGFSGTITPATIDGYDGYSVSILPDTPFTLGDFIDVFITVKDGYGFDGYSDYTFEVDDIFEPVVTQIDPAPGAESSRRPYVRFKIHDSGGIGVDGSRLDVFFDTEYAIIDGIVQSGFVGSIQPTVVDSFDGYSVWFRLPTRFDTGTTHYVTIDGYDLYDNHLNYVYSFVVTNDETIPVFEEFNPAPNEVAVPRDTTIFFEFNDNDGYMWVSDPGTLNVSIDGYSAVQNGTAVNGHVLSLTPNVNDGYDVEITLPFDLPEFAWITVDLDGYDQAYNKAIYNYSFRTADETSPVIGNLDPASGASYVSVTTDVSFDVTDGYSGIDLDTLNVTIDGNTAVVNGVPDTGDGYGLTVSDITDGYNIIVSGSSLAEWQTANVYISVSDIEGNNTSISYGFVADDITSPVIQNIQPSPWSIDVDNHIQISFEFTDGMSGPNLGSISVLADGVPLVSNGVPAFGITLNTTPVVGGYLLSIKELVFTEGQQIYIEIDGYDNSGNRAYETYALTGAFVRPEFSNISPAPNSVSVPLNTDIEFDVTDAYGINTSTLDAYVDGYQVISGGVATDGYSVTLSEITDGYNVLFSFNTLLSESTDKYVRLGCYDKNGIFGQEFFTFKTIGTAPPVFENITPLPYSIDQSEDASIQLTIRDLGGNWIVQSSIDIDVNFYPAIVGGVAQDGYTLTLETVNDGYNVTVGHTRFDPYSRVHVDLFATNVDGVSDGYSYYYDVSEHAFPDVVNQNPANEEVDVSRDAYICFDVVDYTDVDFDSIEVRINDQLAFADGEFTAEFSDAYSSVEPIYILEHVYYPNIVPTYTPVLQYFPPQPYSYQEYYEDGYFDGYEYIITDSGFITVDGYTDGYYDEVGQTFDGYIDDGYDAYEPIDTIGYSFCVDKISPYDFADVVNVDVYAKDTLGNGGTRSYYFTIVSESGPPTFIPIYPLVSSVTVPLDSSVLFSVLDSGGSGVELSTLNASVAGKLAIISGDFQDGYSGTYTQIVDGYEVDIIPNNDLPNWETISVSLYAEDRLGNSATFDYDFRTIDELAPTFDQLFPAPNDIDIPTDTSISFEFNDHTDSGANLNTLNVSIDGYLAINAGVLQDGYSADITINDKDGYDVTIYPPTNLPEFKSINIFIDGYDYAGNYGSISYSWRTADETPPAFVDLNPYYPGSKASIAGQIYIHIVETGSGLDESTLNVSVDGNDIIVNGVTQPVGYVTSLSSRSDGYDLTLQSIGPLPHEIDTDTVVMWKLDDLTTAIDNATGNSDLDGIAIGPSPVSGKFDGAFAFSSANDRIVVDADSALALQNITIEAWIKPSVLSGEHTIYTFFPKQTESAARGIAFKVLANGSVAVDIGDGSSQFSRVSSSTGLVSAGSYHHVAVVISVTDEYVKIIVDGALDTTESLPVTNIEYTDGAVGFPLAASVLIGNIFNPLTGLFKDVFIGELDDIRVSNVAREVSEVAESYNRSLSVTFSEYQLVPVEISASDFSGNDGYINYTFYTLDETLPVFENLSPAAGEIRVDTNTDIEFDFVDEHSGPNIDTLNVTVDGNQVVIGGLGNNASVSFVPITDGYRVTIDLDYILPESSNIIVTLDGYDIDPNQNIFTYQFSTDDYTSPAVANRSPSGGDVDVNPFTDIVFVVHDFGGSALDPSTLNVVVDSKQAIINGVDGSGWTSSYSFVQVDGYDGYRYVLDYSGRLDLNKLIAISIDGYDAYGNYFDDNYSFTTYEDIDGPEFVNLDPDSGEVEVEFDSTISFDIIDGYDIDTDALDVYVENQPAVLNGVFQTGFDGYFSSISETVDGYTIVIDPTTLFVYNQEVNVEADGYDLSGNHTNFAYSFFAISDVAAPTISNRNPDLGDTEVSIYTGVGFDITDGISGVDIGELDVYIDTYAAIIDGIVQYGWNGSGSGVQSIVDGYSISLVPIDGYGFTYNDTPVVTIDGYDNAYNHVHDVYSFAVTSDVLAPTLDAFDPTPSQTEVPVVTSVEFGIVDDVSGVDLTRLNVYIGSDQAMVGGIIQPGYINDNGGISARTDGYTITLDPTNNFDYAEVVTVTIDGYDYADNHINYVYQFTTKVDVDGPTIVPVIPTSSAVDVSRFTDIEFKILDYETGVDLDGLDVYVDGTLVVENGFIVPAAGFDGITSGITQISDGYQVLLDSTIQLEPGYIVVVAVDGYDNVSNHTHYEYSFTTTDDAGPYAYNFVPAPNSVDVENDKVVIDFKVRDYGSGTVDLNTLFISVAEDIGEPYMTIYNPTWNYYYGPLNGWVVSVTPSGNEYNVHAVKQEQGKSFAVYSLVVEADDNLGNSGTTTMGKSPELVGTMVGVVSGLNSINVGQDVIDAYGIESGDMAVIHGIGEFEIDGYSVDDIIFASNIGDSGAQVISVYRGSFMVEKRIFGIDNAEATSSFTVELTLTDPYQVAGSILDPSAYSVVGGDFIITVTGVDEVNEDTIELTFNRALQPDVVYTLTITDYTNVFNLFDFPITTGYNSTTFVGYPDNISPRVSQALVEPYNINVTVIFDDNMRQEPELYDTNNYRLTHGAYATSVSPGVTPDRVVLTVERMYNRAWFGITVTGVRDEFLNDIDEQYNYVVITLHPTSAALSGITGRLKTRDAVRRLYEDSEYWYVGTTGGLDIASKDEMNNVGFVLDAYGYNAITADDQYVYFGANDGYDGYGVLKLAFSDIDRDSRQHVSEAFNVPAIQSDEINDLARAVVSGKNIIAIATSAGATVVIDGSEVHYSSGSNISSVAVTAGGILYIGNNSAGRVEVYYDIDDNTTHNIAPDAFYSTSTSPEISNAYISQIKVVENTSVMDSGSNTVYVATNNGLTRIETDESVPGSSESDGLSLIYGIEGSGATYEVLGGTVNEVIAVDINMDNLQIFVMTDNSTHDGGLTIVNIPSNAQFSFSSEDNGGLISADLADLTFKNL